MQQVDISIIIPTFNRLWSLPDAVASCRKNACNVELIVIDDGSTDNTLNWLNEQNNITILQQENLGKCWAVNRGVNIAKGTYIRFLDSDDMLDDFANDEQFKLAKQTNADIVVSGYKNFVSNGSVTKIQPWFDTDDFISQQLGESDGSHYSSFLFRKDFIADIPHRPDFALRDDRLFILEVFLKSPLVAIHCGTALLHRTLSTDRLQFNTGLKQQVQNFQHLNIYKHILKQLIKNSALTQRRINAATKILWPIAHWIAKDHLKDANEVVKWIYELDPDFEVPNKGLLGKLYNVLGFYRTEKLLHYRRLLKTRFK